MIIKPDNRLILWTAIIGIPAIFIIDIFPSELFVPVIILSVFVITAAIDFASCFLRLKGISINCDEVTRLIKKRKGIITIFINGRIKIKKLKLALVLPKEIYSEKKVVSLKLEKNEQQYYLWECRPATLGKYDINLCFAETESVLKLWLVRKMYDIKSEIRVYPNLLDESRQLASIFCNRSMTGMHIVRQLGRGREFEKLREYIPGDAYNTIHWKTTAKRGKPVTKVFQLERTREVYIIIDTSRLSARNVIDENTGEEFNVTALERYLTAALLLGVVIEKQSDLFGILTFSNTVNTFIRARNGRQHYNSCKNLLYCLKPRSVSPDFNEIAIYIRTKLNRRSLLIFLTSLEDPVVSESFISSMDLISRHHLIMINMLDFWGMQPLFSIKDTESDEEIFEQLAQHILWKRIFNIKRILQSKGIKLNLIKNEKLCTSLISQYINLKQRQVL